METGRNDPCPCGSGKKYKRCCLGLDRQAGAARSQAGQVRAIAAGATEWQADVVAMAARLEGDAASRLAAVLVVAEGFIVHTDVVNRASPEPEAMAARLAAAIRTAGERLGHFPDRVLVRDAEVAGVLSGLLGSSIEPGSPARGRPPAVVAGPLLDLDEAAYALAEHSSGRPGRHLVSSPDTWAGWDLPEEIVARLFQVAAAFHRSAPWTRMLNLDALEAVMLGGRRWTVCVLGNAGQEFGLALYSEADDFWSMSHGTDEKAGLDDLQGRVFAINFDAGADIPRAMRREVASAGWEVAGPAAYPRIFAVNAPAGGVRRRDAEDLVALLAAVPRFQAAHTAEMERSQPVEAWRDEETGVVLTYRPEGDGPGVFWPEVGVLAPGSAGGPGADPEAVLAVAAAASEEPEKFHDREIVVVDRFAAHLAEREGLAPSTVAKHAGNAAVFVDFLAGTGVPVRAVHEYDLRVFLFDWYPRKSEDSDTRMKTMPGSLQRFFDFLAGEEGILCPWAAPLLADRDTLAARWEDVPSGPFWSTDVGAWRAGHDEDLDERLMLPDAALADDESWGELMGPTEAQLHGELLRRWLLWRDEILTAGDVGGDALARQLVARQQKWAGAPHPDLEGKSPLQAIREERRRQGKLPPMLELLRRPGPPADDR